MKIKASNGVVCLLVIITMAIGSSFLSNAASAAASQAATVNTFNPVADAYVNSSSPDSNYGKNVSLRVDGSPVVRSYLRFDLSGLNSDLIQTAVLRIYANSASATGYSVHALANDQWNETSITYSNAPAAGTILNDSHPFNAGVWTVVDISSYVHGDGNYDVVLTTSDITAINLAAREAADKAPQLVVTSASAPTATPVHTVTQPASPSPTQPAGPTPTSSATPSGTDWQPIFPIRAAFYYPWFPEAWTQLGIYPYTNYTPQSGYYSSADLNIVKQHIAMMQYANIQAGIASWWGQGQPTDAKFGGLLSAAAGTHFRWAIYYEGEGQGDPSVSQIQNDLIYLRDHYGAKPSYLRVDGRFVVFVYADATDGCGMADRWKQANTVNAYVVLKVFAGYRNCASQPDGWHQYSPAVATDQQGTFSYSISPGFWKKGDTVRLARDLNQWAQNVKDMNASGANWQLITTFNEWGEGTGVEPAVEWSSASGYGQYLDVLHANGNLSLPTATPTKSALPTATPTNQPLPTATPTDLPGSSPTPTVTTQPTATSTGSKDPILFINGDLVSGDSVPRAQLVVALIQNLMAQHAGTKMLVASVGDNEQETTPTLADYQNYFGTTYGIFVQMGIFMQVRGNHDVQDAGHGAAYAEYFGANSHLDANGLTNYSYNLGTWHIIGLDQLNGTVNPLTLAFLQSDLAASSQYECQLVYWHVPTYSSGSAHGDAPGLIPLNQAEYNAGVDIQVNGHDHDYQRFYPINPSGVRDDAKGITTFIAGIGGQDDRVGSQVSRAQAASAVYMDNFLGNHAIGVVMFTLHKSSADFATYDAYTGTILDSGTIPCH